jgi:predicted glycosyltransferase
VTRAALIVVTHLLGVGHLTRAAALGRGLVAAGWRVTLASGGREAPTIDARGLDLVQLPPVHAVGADFRTLYAAPGRVADAAYLAERERALLAAFDDARPDVVVTELFPFGRRQLRGEFLALLARAQARRPRPAILSSIRDVLNPPSRPDKADEALTILGRSYDGVLVHGDPSWIELGASWPVTPPLARRLRYTGYVRDQEEAPATSRTSGDDVLVSSGGSAAGLPLARAALAAAAALPGRRVRVLVGHGVPETEFAALRAAAPADALVERARRDFPALLAAAKVSVSQAGYNTVLDLAAASARAVLAPFAQGAEREQTIRAEALAAKGLVHVVPEADLTPARLAEAVNRAAASPRPDWAAFATDGAARSAAFVAAAAEAARALNAAWGRLETALDRLRADGRTLPIWVRDDDAVAPTPALARFLDALGRRAIPLGLAVIPARAEPSLPGLLDGRPVDVLVHGWAHANHASPHAKRCELPETRAAAEVEAELVEALGRTRDLFGDRALPVFVPPWNRIGASHAARLPALGYRGLSTFAKRRGAAARQGLRRADAHWDPIAWRAGGGLADEAALLDRLAAAAEDEGAAAPGALEPLGLLTHHLVHDGWIERFLEEVLERLAAGPVRFLAPREVFALR